MNTNKLFVFFVLLLCSFSCNILHAQLGIKAGLTSSSIFNNELDIRAHAGLVYGIKVSNNLLLEPGILYNTKGGQASLIKGENPFEPIYTHHFIDVPLTAKYVFDLANVDFYFQSGISFSYGFSERVRDVFHGEDCPGEPNALFFKKYDFSLLGGAGIIINRAIHLGFTLNKPLINRYSSIERENDVISYLTSLQIGVTYFLIK